MVSGKFFQGDRETMRPSFVVTRFGESVARAKIVGVVVEKFVSEDRRFASITVDDGTEAIHARVFSEDLGIIEDVGPGDLVTVVGKVKRYNDENYIAPDFVKKSSDPNYETLFRLELLKNIRAKKKAADEIRKMRDRMSDEELEEYASEKFGFDKSVLSAILGSGEESVDYRPMILSVMDRLDDGSGVEIGKLLEACEIDESMAESAVSDLISSGEVYEPTVGKLRRVRS